MRGIFSLLVAALPLGLALAGAPLELPSTPAGKVLAGYLEAVNSGNKDRLEAFVKAHRPDQPDALDRMLDLRWNTGGFDLYSIEYRSNPPMFHRRSTMRSRAVGKSGRCALTKASSLSLLPEFRASR